MPRGNLCKVDLNERAVYMRTPRGGCKLVLAGYVYRIKSKVQGREYYACDADCNVSVVVADGLVRSLRGKHNHGPERDKISVMMVCDPPGPGPGARKASGWQDPHGSGSLASSGLEARSAGAGTSGDTVKPEAIEGDESAGAGMMDHAEAGPSGYGDDVRVKLEPEWVDAGALEPNCELEGQYEDNQDFNSGYSEDAHGNHPDEPSFHHMYSGEQQQHQQPGQMPLVPDSQDPIKLRVPGKPNLTITVAPTRPAASQNNPPPSGPPPLHLINPIMNRKRGRPRGSAYGSYSEMDDRMTTILTDSIIASQKLEKMGAAAYHPPPMAAAMSALASRVKPRSKDPEAVRAADIVNSAQNRSGPRVNEELEKVHLKLRQEVLALEVQNLKAEREKLKAYRRNVAIRKEIMMLHLQLGKGIPSECASSGRGFETVNVSDYVGTEMDSDFSNATRHEEVTLSKKLPGVSITRNQPSQSPKISIRKSLQTSNQSPNVSPLSNSSSAKGATPPPGNTNKHVTKEPSRNSITQPGDRRQSCESSSAADDRQLSEIRQFSDKKHLSDTSINRHFIDNSNLSPSRLPDDSAQTDRKPSVETANDHQANENRGMASGDTGQQSAPPSDSGKDDLVPLDSVSSDLSIEMLSEPGSSQWTNQSSAPMTEPEGFDDLQFEGEDSYDNADQMGEFSGAPVTSKDPSDAQYMSYPEESAQKRRRVENMWEPDEGPL